MPFQSDVLMAVAALTGSQTPGKTPLGVQCVGTETTGGILPFFFKVIFQTWLVPFEPNRIPVSLCDTENGLVQDDAGLTPGARSLAGKQRTQNGSAIAVITPRPKRTPPQSAKAFDHAW